MSTAKLLTSLQKHTGTTRSEAITVLCIALVVAAGTFGPWIFGSPSLHEVATADRILAMLDSSAKAAMSAHASVDTAVVGEPYTRATPKALKSSLNINTASLAQLERLPGVGPATAIAIVKRRSMRPFRSVDDLMDVRGIGTKKLEKIRAYVTCGK